MKFEDFLITISKQSLYVLDQKIPLDLYKPIDLSIHSQAIGSVDWSNPKLSEDFVAQYLISNNASVAYGGYLEERSLYSSINSSIGKENRTIHLGIDFWCDEGTRVLALLDGEIHSFQNNNDHGDYGPTIILKHSIDGFEFYSLYGHLSLESVANLQTGQKVQQGQTIGQLGSYEINGGYAPHLHFQLIKDLQGNFGDYPGVCSRIELEFYKENCPDPNLVLKLN